MNLPRTWNGKELFQEGCGGVDGFKNTDFKNDKGCYSSSSDGGLEIQIRGAIMDSVGVGHTLNNLSVGDSICKPLKHVFLQMYPPKPHIRFPKSSCDFSPHVDTE